MSFVSVLFDGDGEHPQAEVADEPDCFGDLNLNQIVDSITAGRSEYNLKPFFYTHVFGADEIRHRQEVFADLEQEPLLQSIRTWAESMRAMRNQLAWTAKLREPYQAESIFVDAVTLYCAAATVLAEALAETQLRSHAMRAFRTYLADYTSSESFVVLRDGAANTKELISDVRYCCHIRGLRVTVTGYDCEPDYSAEVQQTFQRFQQGAVKDYRTDVHTTLEMDHVEAKILHLVASRNPEVFLALDRFYEEHRAYQDATIFRFDREIQFYVAYLEYMRRTRQPGLSFCRPDVSEEPGEVRAHDFFDLALSDRADSSEPLVCNDVHLVDRQRVIVVTGPNQGGKTTFARAFGQLLYLAGLGCPVPGSEAQLSVFDKLFTHFERQEHIETLRGKLLDELTRMHSILDRATRRSIIVMNETFTSTTIQDALLLGTQVVAKIVSLEALCVCVTFVYELSTLGDQVVSMTAMTDPRDPAVRTYKIVQRASDGHAYASFNVQRYGLSFGQLRERLGS